MTPVPEGRLSIAIVIATTGRPRTVRLALERLATQSRAPDRIVVVGVTKEDLAEIDPILHRAEVHLAPRGLTRQRNHALEVLRGEPDLILFLDDDFVPADSYLDQAESLFLANPDIVGATGRLIADGANGPGLTFENAMTLLSGDMAPAGDPPDLRGRRALYGCNMAIRATAIGSLRFDENLPLYGWQEDIDFSFQLGALGRLVHCSTMVGVHLGEKAGRTSGRRVGYSQIANPVYLLRKGSIPRDRARRIMRDNVAANLWRSLKPEPYVDRRGRLLGNALAMRDFVTGRLDPRRILDFS